MACRSYLGLGPGVLPVSSYWGLGPAAYRLIPPQYPIAIPSFISQKDKAVYYKADKTDCSACPQKARCTKAPQRLVMRLLHEDALNRMHQRATPEAMTLERAVELLTERRAKSA